MSTYTPVFYDRGTTDLVIRYDNAYSVVGGGGGGAHAASHENGGADEISVAGLSGLLADPQTPTAHATSHQNGGADEISVLGLSGLLADAQTPLAHASSHQNGGADEIDVTALSGRLADAQNVTIRKNSGANVGTRPRINLIEGANITLTVSDDAPNSEVDVTIAASGGGGSLTNGTATLNFGAAPGSSRASVDVTTAIGAGNLAMAGLMYEASADHNAEEHALLADYLKLTAYRSAANTLTIEARTELRLTGDVAVRWFWSA